MWLRTRSVEEVVHNVMSVLSTPCISQVLCTRVVCCLLLPPSLRSSMLASPLSSRGSLLDAPLSARGSPLSSRGSLLAAPLSARGSELATSLHVPHRDVVGS